MNSLLRIVEPGSGGSELLLTLSLNSTTGPVTLISVYALTLSATPDTKGMFYENLASIIRNIPSKEQVVVLGDFNARVGTDHGSWPSCPGQSGVGKMNENGQRLLVLCIFHEMSARYLNQTSWSSSLRPLRRNFDPCNLVTLPQRSGKLCVTLCTALLWLPLGRGPQNHMTGSKPNQL